MAHRINTKNDDANTWAQYQPSDSVTNIVLGTSTGPLNALGAITAGTAYTAGTYTNVPLTGGTGFGAQATVVVAAGGVTTVTVTQRGNGYTAADSLSALAANIGGTGTGFAVAVTSVFGGTANLYIPAGYDVVSINADGNLWFNFNGQTAAVPTVAGATGVNGSVLNPSLAWVFGNLVSHSGLGYISIAGTGTIRLSAEWFIGVRGPVSAG